MHHKPYGIQQKYVKEHAKRLYVAMHLRCEFKYLPYYFKRLISQPPYLNVFCVKPAQFILSHFIS